MARAGAYLRASSDPAESWLGGGLWSCLVPAGGRAAPIPEPWRMSRSGPRSKVGSLLTRTFACSTWNTMKPRRRPIRAPARRAGPSDHGSGMFQARASDRSALSRSPVLRCGDPPPSGWSSAADAGLRGIALRPGTPGFYVERPGGQSRQQLVDDGLELVAAQGRWRGRHAPTRAPVVRALWCSTWNVGEGSRGTRPPGGCGLRPAAILGWVRGGRSALTRVLVEHRVLGDEGCSMWDAMWLDPVGRRGEDVPDDRQLPRFYIERSAGRRAGGASYRWSRDGPAAAPTPSPGLGPGTPNRGVST